MKIFSSVGFNSVNDPKDIAVVRYLLGIQMTNQPFNLMMAPLTVSPQNVFNNQANNVVSIKDIIIAIKNFQEQILWQIRPTGQIFPDDVTFKKLSSGNFYHPKHYVRSKSEDPVITPGIEPRIDEVSEQFFAYTGKTLIITSGYRGPERQAKAMFDKVNDTSGANSGNDKIFDKIILDSYMAYADKRSSKEIYDQMVESRKKHIDAKTKLINNTAMYQRDATQKMAEVISKQIANGIYISKHATNKAFDCSVNNLKGSDIIILKLLVKNLGGKTPDEITGPPHIHIQF